MFITLFGFFLSSCRNESCETNTNVHKSIGRPRETIRRNKYIKELSVYLQASAKCQSKFYTRYCDYRNYLYTINAHFTRLGPLQQCKRAILTTTLLLTGRWKLTTMWRSTICWTSTTTC